MIIILTTLSSVDPSRIPRNASENPSGGLSRVLHFYNRGERPQYHDKLTVNVAVTVDEMKVRFENEYSPMDLEVDMVVSMFWDDNRLAGAASGFSGGVFRTTDGSDLWSPASLMFRNMVQGGEVDAGTRFLLFSEGAVQRDTRIKGRYSCMEVDDNSFTCPIIMYQMVYPETDMTLAWASSAPFTTRQLVHDIDLGQRDLYTVDSIETHSSTFSMFEARPGHFSSPLFSQLSMTVHIQGPPSVVEREINDVM